MQIENKSEKKYRSGRHTIFSCQYHIIFCTKYRRKVLDTDVENRLKDLILEKQEQYSYKVIEMEVMPDHVHLLLDINPEIGVYYVISKIKGFTSFTIRKEFKKVRTRIPSLWTLSRFISTVGSVSLEVVKKYIEEQKNV